MSLPIIIFVFLTMHPPPLHAPDVQRVMYVMWVNLEQRMNKKSYLVLLQR